MHSGTQSKPDGENRHVITYEADGLLVYFKGHNKTEENKKKLYILNVHEKHTNRMQTQNFRKF